MKLQLYFYYGRVKRYIGFGDEKTALSTQGEKFSHGGGGYKELAGMGSKVHHGKKKHQANTENACRWEVET